MSDPNHLIVALAAPPQSLDPRRATDATGMRITSLIYSSLVKLGPDLRPIGDAARTWSFDQKNLAYTFFLPRKLNFHDGQAVTKNDLEFTFYEYRKATSPFQNSLKVIKSVEVREEPKEFIVILNLSQFSASFLTDLVPIKILPSHLLSRSSWQREKAFVPVGSGPFQFDSQDVSEIKLFRKEGPYQHLTFKIVRDDNTRFLRIVKGDFDIVQGDVPLQKVSYLKSRPFLKVYRYAGLSMTYLLLNLKNPVLKNKEVRQALASSISREEIIKYKLEGYGRPATSILTPENFFFDSSLKNLPLDLKAAEKTLSRLNLGEISFTLKSSNNPQAVENAKILSHQMRLAGFKVKIESYEWGTFYSDIQKGRFEMATMRWVGATDPDILRVAFHTSELPPGRNRGSYSNPSLDALLEQGLKESDENKRKLVYLTIQQKIHEDLPIVPLWYDDQVAVAHVRVENYSPPANGDFSSFLNVRKNKNL